MGVNGDCKSDVCLDLDIRFIFCVFISARLR
jgi:hypothetical protein